MLAVAALYTLLTTCAPNVEYPTMASIAQVESGGNPYAVGDNTTGVSYQPPSYNNAVQLVTQLIGEGHSVDMGIVQVNSQHLRTYGLSVAQLLSPCTNAKVGGLILSDAYSRAVGVFGPGRVALAHAISAYNTGSLYAGGAYVQRVINAAVQLGFVQNSNVAYEPPPAPAERVSYAVETPVYHAAPRKASPRQPTRLERARASNISIPLPHVATNSAVMYEPAEKADN